MTGTPSTLAPSTRCSERRACGSSVPRAPRANAFAERWVRTVRTECLDWTLVRGRPHLERVLRTYTAHYNQARPHRGLDLATPEPEKRALHGGRHSGSVIRHDVLGGLIHEYEVAV